MNLIREPKVSNKPSNPKKQKRRHKASGVKKVFIIAIVEDVPEVYENIKIILEKLKLDTDEMDFCLASDLKLINTIGQSESLNISVRVLFKNQFFYSSIIYSF